MVGLILLPLQLYSLWLVVSLLSKPTELKQRHLFKIIATIGLDLAIVIVIWSLIS